MNNTICNSNYLALIWHSGEKKSFKFDNGQQSAVSITIHLGQRAAILDIGELSNTGFAAFPLLVSGTLSEENSRHHERR